jgi:hypothetical protein
VQGQADGGRGSTVRARALDAAPDGDRRVRGPPGRVLDGLAAERRQDPARADPVQRAPECAHLFDRVLDEARGGVHGAVGVAGDDHAQQRDPARFPQRGSG